MSNVISLFGSAQTRPTPDEVYGLSLQIQHEKFKAHAEGVVLDYLYRSIEDGCPQKSVKEIARAVKSSGRTVSRRLRNLQDMGILRVIPHGSAEEGAEANEYRVDFSAIRRLAGMSFLSVPL